MQKKDTRQLVKISRHGERFWVEIIHVTRSKIYAKVSNDVIFQPFSYGDMIVIDEDEILDYPYWLSLTK